MLFGNFNDTQNKKIVANLQDNLKLNPTTDAIPRQVLPTIQPVYEAGQRITESTLSSNSTASGNLTLATTNTTRDTYITFYSLSFIKDATCDVATGSIMLVATLKGIQTVIARIPLLTLTAQSEHGVYCLEKPIRVDRGTSIYVTSDAHTAGNFVKTVNVGYYLGDIGQEEFPV